MSAYCPCKLCCGPHAKGITSSRLPVTANGGVFVANKTLPFGSMVIIPGYNGGRPVPVLDRGPFVAGRTFDVYFPTHAAAKKWGVRTVRVEVLR